MSDDLIREAKDFFEEAQSFESEWRTLWADDLRFGAGDQWDDIAKRARDGSDGEAPRPTMVFDQTDQYIRQIVNDMRMNPVAMKALGVDDVSDPEVAEKLQELFRHIEAVSRAPMAYFTAGEWAARIGRGFFRVYGAPVGDPKRNLYEPRIGTIENALNVYFDPLSVKLDGSDASDAILVVEMSKKSFKRKYGIDAGSWEDDDKGWSTNDSVRIAEWHSVREGKAKKVKDEQGEYSPDEYGKMVAAGERKGDNYREEESTEKRARIRKVTCHEILEDDDFAGGAVGLIPVYGNIRYTDKGRDVRGAIRNAKDSQRLLNYLGSNFAEAASGQTKTPWIAPAEATAGYEHMWDNANRVPFSTLYYNQFHKGQPVNAPTRNNVDLNLAGYANSMQFMSGMIQASLGQYQASIGGPSRETSRVAIDKREQQSDTATYHYNGNLAVSIEYAGRIVMRCISAYYDVARVQKILGEDNESGMVMIDPNAPAPYQRGEDPRTGKAMEVLNPRLGEYDVITSIGPSFTTKREQAAAQLGEIMARNPQEMAIGGDIYYNTLDVPGAKQLAKRKSFPTGVISFARVLGQCENVEPMRVTVDGVQVRAWRRTH